MIEFRLGQFLLRAPFRASCPRLPAQLLHISAHLVQSVQSVKPGHTSLPPPPRNASEFRAPRYSREQTHPDAGNEEVAYLLIAGTRVSLFTVITGGLAPGGAPRRRWLRRLVDCRRWDEHQSLSASTKPRGRFLRSPPPNGRDVHRREREYIPGAGADLECWDIG